MTVPLNLPGEQSSFLKFLKTIIICPLSLIPHFVIVEGKVVLSLLYTLTYSLHVHTSVFLKTSLYCL